MKRRGVLSATGALLSATLAGCSEFQNVSAGSQQYSLGESAKYRGLAVTVEDYLSVESVTFPISFGETRNYKPDGDRVVLLIEFEVENIGDEVNEFPEFEPEPVDSEITASYFGEELTRPRIAGVEDYFSAKGKEYTRYRKIVGGIKDGPYPGDSISGFVPFEIVSDFNPAEVIISVDVNGTKFHWQLATA